MVTLRPDCQCVDGKARVKVVALFSRANSFVLQKDTNNLELLRHEQIHFDIVEVYARLCRRELKTLDLPCSKMQSLQTMVKYYRLMQHAENEKYDKETNHYNNKEEQERWSKDVARRLVELAIYRI